MPLAPRACLALLVVSSAIASACDAARPDRDALLAAIATHAERFEGFDAWARRTLAAEPSSPGSRAFEATLFAPVRGDALVLDAWVERDGAAARRWRMRQGDFTLALEDVRDGRLGPLRAGLGARVVNDRERAIVVITRSKEASATTRIVVTLVCLASEE